MNAAGGVEFEFELNDNVVPTTERMIAAQDRLANKAKTTTTEFEKQRVKNIECLAALNSFRGGLNQFASSMNTLGMIDEKTYESMRKLVAGITLFTASAEVLKSTAVIYNMLTASSMRFAVASIFAAAAQHPLLAAAAIGGAGMVAYGAISAMNQQGPTSTSQMSTTNSTIINLNSYPSSNERTASAALATGSYY